MRRGAKPAKAKAKAARPVARKSPKIEGSRTRELEKRLAETLEQQAATAEILRVIGRSRTDLQPVFDAIVESAARLCDARFTALYRYDGDLVHVAAHHNLTPEVLAILQRLYPMRPTHEQASGRAIMGAAVVHLPDVLADPEYRHEVAIAGGWASLLAVPMIREGRAVGTINIYRGQAEPFPENQIELLKTFADQAVIAIENVRLFKELEARNTSLSESLEQQTATAEILRVISSSPTDIQPVLDAVAENAARLCNSMDAQIFRVDGDALRLVASYGSIEAISLGDTLPINRGFAVGRAVLDLQTIHLPDVFAVEAEFPGTAALARRQAYRTTLATPLLREGVALGAVVIRRAEVRPFTDAQVKLLQTFADQAVIAIENVRLFKELGARNRDLTEALEQQTATAEILRVISRSQTDVQPVFDTIVRSAVNLCDGLFSALFQYDGELIHQVAQHNYTPEALEEARRAYPMRPRPARGSGRAILERAVVHMPDVEVDREYEHTGLASVIGFRSGLWVPMLRDGAPIGVIVVSRAEPGPFSENEIELLKTFADQAVIAVENVRLFKELEARNRDLTVALEQQTATGEILRVISSSPTDVQPVFDAIASSATRLCDGLWGLVFRFDGEMITLAADYGSSPEGLEVIRGAYPAPPGRLSVAAQAILERRVIAIADAQSGSEYPHVAERAKAIGYRSILSVPMLRGDAAIGAINVIRVEAIPFSDTQVELLKTFADQAVIAIENVRLFKELEARNAELTTALDQQTATSEILRTISSSPTDVQPVFETILDSAKRLLGAFSAMVVQRAGDELHLAALSSVSAAGDARVRQAFPIPIGEPSTAPPIITPILSRQPFVISDAETQADVNEATREIARARGYRSQLVVPLLREHSAIGVISVTRQEAGGFTQDEVALLQTFADQAVIAVENVRLFKELEARNRDLTVALEQQTATSEILRVISGSQTDVRPVFEAIADAVVRLFQPWSMGVYRFDGEFFELAASRGGLPGSEEHFREVSTRQRATRDSLPGRCLLDRATVHIADVESDPNPLTSLPTLREFARRRGWRAVLQVPMLRDDQPVGLISITRTSAGPFTTSEIDLLKTFASQAVIAIENERLFKELEARTGELTRSVEKLTALGEVSRAVSSTLDVETVLDTIVSRASQLAGADGCSIFEYDAAAQQFELRATHNVDTAFVEALRAVPLRKGEGLMGRAAEMREPIQIPDITQPGAYQSSVRDTLIRFGYRALLSVPLLREDQIIGSLSFNRKAPGEFPPEVVDVLKTFATQSALAIQNARLFREIADKSAQLEAASRHKSEFLANMSHELRTPLNAIIGFSEILAEKMFGDINEKQTEYLQDILESGRHLLSLINDILDLSKIEAGRMELELSEFDLPNAIENALILVRERASRRGIALGHSIDERLGMIGGDERKVKQVLLNLLSNALKFTPEGGRIDIDARLHDGVAEVSIADTGVGIAPADQDAVFEEFRQVGTADKKAEGTGLGLALSRKFIELHGGRIWVKSEVGAGSTFTFTLPVG
jgi:GAF domain-containing protein